MYPVLFSIGPIDVQAYGVSKALAALIAAFLLGRAFARAGWRRDDAYDLVVWATVWGFAGAKLYYLAEQLPDVTWHDLGGSGFTWYGGLAAGIVTFLVMVKRRGLPVARVADAAAVPLSVAYAVGRVGCWLAGDGTHGKPSGLPWAMPVPGGAMPTDVPVHPTALYEAAAALVIAGVLVLIGRRSAVPWTVFSAYLVLSGVARFLVEFLRINDPWMLGLSQPQWWAMASVVAGVLLWWRARRALGASPATVFAGAEQAVHRVS